MKSQQNPYLLRAVDWNEVFPWILLRKCLRFGFSLRLLVCVTLTLAAWAVLFCWLFFGQWVLFIPDTKTYVDPLFQNPAWNRAFISNFVHVLSQSPAVWWAKFLLVGFFVLDIFFIQMIVARMTAVRIATGIRPSLFHAAGMVWKRFPAALAGLAFMVLGIGLSLLPVWLISLLPTVLAGLLAPVAILFCFLAVFIILGAIFGLPLMLTALMCENSDCFDALSRAYAYSLQRPMRYAFYLLAGAFFGILGYVAMHMLVALTVTLFTAFFGYFPRSPVIGFCILTAWLLPISFAVIYVTSLFSGIYMLLRRDVDAVELDEVWLPKSQGVPLPELPKLKTDPKN